MVELSIRSYTGDRRRVGKISKHTTSKGESTSVQLYLRFWNDGGVPAWITDITIRGGLVGELPEIPRDDVDLIYSRIGPEPIGVSAEPVEYELFLQYPGWNDGPGGMGTVFYGLIRYRDVFSSKLSTRFAYTLTSGGDLQRLAGFAEYNNNA